MLSNWTEKLWQKKWEGCVMRREQQEMKCVWVPVYLQTEADAGSHFLFGL